MTITFISSFSAQGVGEGPLVSPQGSPGVLEFWKNCKNFQKLYKKYKCKIYPKLYSQHQFWGTWMPWGGLRGQNLQVGVVGHFPPPMIFFQKFPDYVLVIKTY